MGITLLEPTKELLDLIIDYRCEFIEFKEDTINGSGGLHGCKNYDKWLMYLKSDSNTKFFFTYLESENKIIGSVRLSTELYDVSYYAGNIGYSIRPQYRRKGYGYKQLLLTLEKAREFGMKEVIISCEKDNIASKKTIERAGGRKFYDDYNISYNRHILMYRIHLA